MPDDPEPRDPKGVHKYKQKNQSSTQPGVNWQSIVTFMTSKLVQKESIMSAFLGIFLLRRHQTSDILRHISTHINYLY